MPEIANRRAWSAWIAALLMVSTSVAASYLRPTHFTADERPRLDLQQQVPTAFGDWRIDDSLVPVLPAPDVQARLDKLYNQLLARTYVDSQGHRVMLSIAYGVNQGSDATQVHRPEFCYVSQGFTIERRTPSALHLAGHEVPVNRLIGVSRTRYEPISYWVTLDETALLPGWQRKLTQLRYGLSGRIPDGMLVRTSTLDLDDHTSFAVQDRFLADLYAHLDPAIRSRYFGR